MEPVLRAAVIYVFLLVVLRTAGRRTFMQRTNFDLVLLLVISEATQQALLGRDYSVTNALVVIITLVLLDVGLSLVKRRWRPLDKLVDGVPTVIVHDGRPLAEQMRKARVDETDVLEQARSSQGIERMDGIRYAILERDGDISIVPKS